MDKQGLLNRIERLYEEEAEYNKGFSELNKRIIALNNEKHKLKLLMSKNVKYRNVLEDELRSNRPKLTPVFTKTEEGSLTIWKAYFEEYPDNVVQERSKTRVSKMLWKSYAIIKESI